MPAPALPKPSPAAVPDLLKLAIVIPTLREAHSLPSLIARLQSALAHAPVHAEILIVDDDSRDGTAELVSALILQDPRIRLLVRKGERGLAGAILHGWQHTDADLLGVLDADLQHPPELLPTLVAAILDGNDLAIASRYVRGGTPGRSSPLRNLISASAILFTRPLQPSRTRISDPMSGYFLVRRSCIQNLAFQPTGFKLLLEILVRGSVDRVREVPYTFGPRTAGKSKATLKVACDYLRLLARLYATRNHNPRTVPNESLGD